MIMDLQGWGRIHNRSSPGSTASLCTFKAQKFKEGNNLLHFFSCSQEIDSVNIINGSRV